MIGLGQPLVVGHDDLQEVGWKRIFFLEDRTLRCLSVGHACAKSLKADRDDSYAKSKHLHAPGFTAMCIEALAVTK